MAGNPKAVQARIGFASTSQVGGQRAHDLRLGASPSYVDKKRKHLNRVLLSPLMGAALKTICLERRKKRKTERGMKSNAAVCITGIITFGHEAQRIFGRLTAEQQDAAYREVAEAIAERLQTSLTGLVVHLDEASNHAHFQCVGVKFDGSPVSDIAGRGAMIDIQSIAAAVMGRHSPGIERGKSRWTRIEEGEDYADTIYKSGQQMRETLPDELAALTAKIGAAQAKLEKNVALSAKALAKAEGDVEHAEKARKNHETYRRRVEAAQTEIAEHESKLQILQQTLEATKKVGRDEGHKEGLREISEAVQVSRMLVLGEFPSGELTVDGEHLRMGAKAIISANEHYMRAGHAYGFKDQRSTWSDAFSRYVGCMDFSSWNDAKDQILNIHQECVTDLNELKPTGSLLERAKTVIATLSRYWNRVGAALARLFKVAPPHSPEVRHGVIQNIFPRPMDEYFYLQPLKQAAQSEIQALQFASKLAESTNDPK